MSIYTYLSTPLPTIAYAILHQAGPSVSPEAYAETMKELHQRIAAETAEVNAGYKKTLQEITVRETQILRGALSQFLETPIRSDNAEVQKIFLDAFQKYGGLITVTGDYGVIRSSEGKLSLPDSQQAAQKRLGRSGKAYLTELGFTFGKASGPVFESVFYVRGGANLDIIEHLVRDRLGIYASTHGKHLAEFSGCLFGAYNVVMDGVPGLQPDAGQAGEAVIWFDKPDMPYGEFRQGLAALLESLAKDGSPASPSLWQRKLGLGRGREFALRLAARNRKKPDEMMQWLHECKLPDVVRNAVMNEGALLTREPVV